VDAESGPTNSEKSEIGLISHDPYECDTLAVAFGSELKFTEWLVEHEVGLAWAIRSLHMLPHGFPMGAKHQVSCPTGMADIVIRTTEGSRLGIPDVVIVIEAQLGVADRDHCQRLVADYMGHFRPDLGILICEQWDPRLEALLDNSRRPVAVFEAKVLLDDLEPVRQEVLLVPVFTHIP
jgi:hypothetical protein